MLRHLSEFLKKNKYRYLIGILILLLVDLLQLVVPQVLKRLTDALVAQSIDKPQIHHFAISIFMLALGISIGRFFWRVLIVWTSLNFETWIRSKLFRHLTGLPREYYNANKTGDLMAHATNDVGTVRHAFGFGVVMSVDALFLTISTILIMISTINLRLTLLALLPMPIIALAVVLLGRIIHRKYRSVQEAFSLLSDKVQESFAGIRVIKSFAQEELDLQDFNQKNELNFKRNMSLAKTHALLHPMVKFIGSISSVLGITFGSTFVLNGSISFGDLVAFLNYLDMLVWPMMAFGFFTNLLQRGAASISRLNVLFDEQSNLHDVAFSAVPQNNSLRVHHLSFTYPGESHEALKDISLDIPSGTSLGILGRTGAGKSTLIGLLLRLYNIPMDTIFLGGQDINTLSIEETRRRIGAVVQDHFLFSTKIRENIAFSDREIDAVKVVEKAKLAQIHDEILTFTEGYDTYLGERGVNLSGGQKQRTSIARLLYKDPPILILDDALSAVDTKTEDKILRHLDDEMKERTSIVVSHRVSTLKKLDQIIVMDEGRILERGTHQQLIDQQGHYYRIFLKQQLEEKIQEE